MKVSDTVKAAYQRDTVTKYISLFFPEIDKEILGEDIYDQSLRLSEKLMDKKSMEFVGCYSSMFKISAHGINYDIEGKKVIVKIWTDGTENEPITLFNGIVKSALSQSNKWNKDITAYDELYIKGNKDIAAWYNSLIFPITLKNLRDSLFNYLGLDQVETSLPNDGVTIKKKYDPNELQALQFIKALCQINGVFGIINREGKFEYRIPGKIKSKSAYPGAHFFPGPDTFPGVGAPSGTDSIKAEYLAYYRRAYYEEYEVKVIDKVTVRQSEDDPGAIYGNGVNNYIVQGNPFTYGLTKQELTEIAKNIYNSIGGFSYYPFQAENNGLPYIECGLDAVSYYVVDWEKTMQPGSTGIVYKERQFYVFNRELSGIQALQDSYNAKGEKYQSEFITDLKTRIDLIKRKQGISKQEVEDYVGDYTYDKDTIDQMIKDFEPGSGGDVDLSDYYTKDEIDEKLEGLDKHISVPSVPSNPVANTIYLIQGAVRVE